MSVTGFLKDEPPSVTGLGFPGDRPQLEVAEEARTREETLLFPFSCNLSDGEYLRLLEQNATN